MRLLVVAMHTRLLLCALSVHHARNTWGVQYHTFSQLCTLDPMQAREYGHACEASEDQDGAGRGVQVGPAAPAYRGPQWDCESVLSRLTNTDNHPGRIAEPSKRQAVVLSGASTRRNAESISQPCTK